MKNNLYFESSLNIFYNLFHNEQFFQIFSSLSEIIVLILILSWILKKMSFLKINNIMSSIKIIDRVSIGSHESIILVEIQDVKLLLGVTTKNITHLHTFSSFIKNQSFKDIETNKIDNLFLKKKL